MLLLAFTDFVFKPDSENHLLAITIAKVTYTVTYTFYLETVWASS